MVRSAWGKACAVGMALASLGAALSLWPARWSDPDHYWVLAVGAIGGLASALWLAAYVADVALARHALVNAAGYCLGVAVVWGLQGGDSALGALLSYLGYAFMGLTGWSLERSAVRNLDYTAGVGR